MASRRMLRDTVVLYIYMGEINDEASHRKVILRNCYCPTNEGIARNNQGKTPNDSGKLYIFDNRTSVESEDGMKLKYCPYPEWDELTDHSDYWTLRSEGNDYFQRPGSSEKMRIIGFSHKTAGSKRMWHFEVDVR